MPAVAIRPTFPETAWRGPFARWRDVVGPVSKAPEVLHFLAFAVVMGLVLHRRVFFEYPYRHYANFYACFIGTTADDHKTTALRFGEELAADLCGALDVVSGISSAEGLLERIGTWEEDTNGSRVAIPARPALLYLDEMGTLLAKARQEATAGIMPLLTRLFDAPPKEELPTRGHPLVVLEPTVGLLTGTTPEVLDRGIREADLTDGLLNRMFWVTPTTTPKPISNPRAPDRTAWNALLLELRHALDTLPEKATEIPLDAAARGAWDDIYTKWRTDRQSMPPSLLTKATARTHTHIRKLALLGAALEGRPQVDEGTLLWAATLGDYFEDVARWLLADAIIGDTRAVTVEQRILRYLRQRQEHPEQRSTRAICQALHRYGTSPEIRAALRGMRDFLVRFDRVKTASGQNSDLWTVL